MNLNLESKGWLERYIKFRKPYFNNYLQYKQRTAHPEHALYKIIQPTGIMYGQSGPLSDLNDSIAWSEKAQLKVQLLESLIGSALIFQDKAIDGERGVEHIVEESIEKIARFYHHVFPEITPLSRTLFGRKKTAYEVVEHVLQKRTENSEGRNDAFWVKFFRNSLLFIDIYSFGHWIHTTGDSVITEYFKFQREELRFSVVKIISSAAHANHTVEFEERKLMEFFVQSAGLSTDQKKEARSIFEKGIEVEDLDLPTNSSWILRKFFIEMAILTIWADKQLEESEQTFLKRLNKHIGLSDDELENSLLALEGFVVSHWKELDKLKNKQALQEVSNHYIERLSRLVEVNKVRLINEARRNKELVMLLSKANQSELSEIDQVRIRGQLLNLLIVIPNFSIVTLPSDLLTLPLLMKIYPSTFFSEVLN